MGLVSEIRDLAGKIGKRGAKAPAAVTTEDRIAAVEAALARLCDERATVNAQIEGAPARRRELLLGDAPDEELCGLDGEIDRLHLRIERLDALEPELLDRLAELRDAARQNRWSSLVHSHDGAVRVHLGRLAAACDSLRAVTEILMEAQASFPVERGARMIGAAGLDHVADAVVVHLEREFDRLSGFDPAVRPLPRPAPAPASPRPPMTADEHAAARELPHGQGSRRIATAGGAPPKPAARPAPTPPRPIVPRLRRNDPPPAEGERRVHIVRPTSGPNCEPLAIGDELSLPEAFARALVLRGSADFTGEG